MAHPAGQTNPKNRASAGPDSYIAHAVASLRHSGLRITTPRMLVLRALANSDQCLTAYGLHERITKDGAHIDVVSVYRILTTLSELGLVHRIGVLDGFTACRQFHEHQDQVQHWVCQECGKVVEVSMAHSETETLVGRARLGGFAPKTVHVEVVGLCAQCQ